MTNDAFSIVPTFQIGHVMGQILRNNVKHLCHQILYFQENSLNMSLILALIQELLKFFVPVGKGLIQDSKKQNLKL